MSLESPVAILYDLAGEPLAVASGVPVPNSGLMAMGSDGVNARFMLMDSSGRPVLVGAGTAGTPVGGVVSIQGVSGGQAVPISGTVTAANPSVGVNASPTPTSSTQVGISDGTNLQAARGFDLDTGAGTEYNIGISIRIPGSGGSVAGGTATNPLRIDPTGTTTQPISAASLPLPTGAATEVTLAARLADSTFTARVNTLGQKTAANSTPVVLASDQSAIPVTQTAASATRTDVTSSASNVTLLALNTARKGATIYNDSTKKLYVKFGTTATTTDFTVLMNAGDYYEVPFGFTGRIDGIWASANGAARMTELT